MEILSFKIDKYFLLPGTGGPMNLALRLNLLFRSTPEVMNDYYVLIQVSEIQKPFVIVVL